MSKLNTDCTTCEPCEDTLVSVDNKLISIADKYLYNVRYGLGRKVDKNLFKLLVFYKKVLQDICDETDCDCYTGMPVGVTIIPETANTAFPTATINHCVCGCCDPMNVLCNSNTAVPCPQANRHNPAVALTRENIIERIKILTA